MLRSTFSRLMAVFIVVILLCVGMLYAVFYITARDAQIDSKVDALKRQAYDIGYLAGSTQAQRMAFTLGNSYPLRELMAQKLQDVKQNYSAYCMLVDRSGETVAYFLSLLKERQELAASFDPQSIVSTVQTVLTGTEVVVRTNSSAGPMFTVAVPWFISGRVAGAVYIQTAAQTIQAAYAGIVARSAAAALATLSIAAILVYFYTRRFVQPLSQMAEAATSFSFGNFEQPVEVTGTTEMRELAVAFNSMAEKLKDTEQVRRDFIANVSHELRSPMTSIRGFLQGILDGTIEPQDQQHYLGIVVAETDRLIKLVSELLNLSRLESQDTAPNMRTFNINELIRLVMVTKHPQLEEKQLDVSFAFAEENCFVLADRDQIEQVLINLVDNAVKFTPPGGRITLSTTRDIHTVYVRVRDTGPGILPEDIPHIFDRFYKADKAHVAGQGTGLGLAISKMIMDQHHQQLRAIAQESGALFELTLAPADGK